MIDDAAGDPPRASELNDGRGRLKDDLDVRATTGGFGTSLFDRACGRVALKRLPRRDLLGCIECVSESPDGGGEGDEGDLAPEDDIDIRDDDEDGPEELEGTCNVDDDGTCSVVCAPALSPNLPTPAFGAVRVLELGPAIFAGVAAAPILTSPTPTLLSHHDPRTLRFGH